MLKNILMAGFIGFVTAIKPIEQTEIDYAESKRFFRYGATNRPKNDTLEYGGDDAWVASPNILIVADGGGLKPPSSVWARQLVANIKEKFDQNEAKELRELMVKGVATNDEEGSSTCVLVKFDTSQTNFIKTSNLGNSGYIIYRPNFKEGTMDLLFASEDQVHNIMVPYNVGKQFEFPYHADDQEHEVQDHDIIIVYSDGLTDNLWEEHIKACFTPHIKLDDKRLPLQTISDCLANNAQETSLSKGVATPISTRIKQQGSHLPKNVTEKFPDMGRPDDITVIVAQIDMKKNWVDQELLTNGTDLKDDEPQSVEEPVVKEEKKKDEPETLVEDKKDEPVVEEKKKEDL